MTTPDTAAIAASLTAIVEKMCREYDRDQFCDYAVINGLLEEAGEVIGYWSREPLGCAVAAVIGERGE